MVGDSLPTSSCGAEGVLVMAIVYVVILLPYLVATLTAIEARAPLTRLFPRAQASPAAKVCCLPEQGPKNQVSIVVHILIGFRV